MHFGNPVKSFILCGFLASRAVATETESEQRAADENAVAVADGRAPEPEDIEGPLPADPEETAECEARGGRMEHGGLMRTPLCIVPLADGGESCTDGAECMGKCLYDEAGTQGSPPAPGTEVAGQCQAESNPFGCFYEVTDGRIEPGLCVD